MKLSVDKGTVEALFIGPAPDEAPTVVFLHEGLGSIGQWRDFPADLAASTGCGALVYDRVGYGRSSPVSLPRPLDYMERDGVEELAAVLVAIGVRAPILFGHSDGGSIALVYASQHPVVAVIAEAAHVFCEDVSVASITAAREAFEHGDLRARLSRHHDDVDGAFLGWNRAWLDPRFRAWNLERFLPGITAPTQVIQGEDDPYGTRAQVEAITRGVRGPVETLLLPTCGHTPHREQRERTLAEATRFVRRWTGAAK